MTADDLATNRQCDTCGQAERNCPSFPSPVGQCHQYRPSFRFVDAVQRRIARQWATANNLKPEEERHALPDMPEQKVRGGGDPRDR